MRNGQKRMRGRNNHRKSQNPLTRVYESNGPDVKIRGTASHIAEKYIQLARDSQSSGDPIAAENYYQHAEHYFRLIAAAQEQFRQQNPYYQQGQQNAPGADEGDDYGDEEAQPFMGQNEPSYAPREPQQQPQPYLPRDAQPFPPREQPVVQQARPYQQGQPQQGGDGGQEVGGLPAFITGGQPQQPQQQQPAQNGHDQQERYGMHRRRRRHRGNFRGERGEFGGPAQGAAPSPQGEGGDEPPAE
jgi:Domain of unknown function (DUF4167)